MKRTSQKRHSKAQWQAIVEQYQASGLSGTQFCKAHGIAYASFCKWRQRFLLPENAHIECSKMAPLTQFIDVGSLSHQAEKPWHIVLKLGNGVELCLSQS